MKKNNKSGPQPARSKSAAGIAIKNQKKGKGPKLVGKSFGLSVTHSELVSIVEAPILNDVTADWEVQVESRVLNPGVSGLFPWLSRIARNYEKFQFDHLRFEYRPSCPTTTSGVYTMCIDYDAEDVHENLTDALEIRSSFMSHPDSVQGSIWSPCSLTVPTNRLRSIGERYVIEDETRSSSNIRLEGVGKVLWAAVDRPTTGGGEWRGDLYVSYTVRLIGPQLVDSTSAKTSIGYLVSDPTSDATFGFDVSVFPGAVIGANVEILEGGDAGGDITAIDVSGSGALTTVKSSKGIHLSSYVEPAFLCNRSFTGEMTIELDYPYPNGNGQFIPQALPPSTYINQYQDTYRIHTLAQPDDLSFRWDKDFTIEVNPIYVGSYTTLDQPTDIALTTMKQIIRVTGQFVKGMIFEIIADDAGTASSNLFASCVKWFTSEFVGVLAGLIIGQERRIPKFAVKEQPRLTLKGFGDDRGLQPRPGTSAIAIPSSAPKGRNLR